jgi:hypothetical protein
MTTEMVSVARIVARVRASRATADTTGPSAEPLPRARLRLYIVTAQIRAWGLRPDTAMRLWKARDELAHLLASELTK